MDVTAVAGEKVETREWAPAICRREGVSSVGPAEAKVLGILAGEGIGPEVTDAAMSVLAAVEERFGIQFDRRVEGGELMLEASETGEMPESMGSWCESVFRDGGAILAGAKGGRFVYDLRREFGLYAKVNPVKPMPELEDVRRVRLEGEREVDVLVLRQNLGGVYQGEARELGDDGERVLEYTFSHRDSEVRRFLEAAVRLAERRSGRLAVIYKDGGLPEMARLWRSITEDILADAGSVECRFIDVDYACYLMVQAPWDFDVIAAPNCFGDILSDLGGLLMGSRGLTYGASYSLSGAAVYQTNHGSAKDLATSGRANPLAHIFSMAAMLRESYGLGAAASEVELAVRRVLGRGVRTEDIAVADSQVVSLKEMAMRVAEEVVGGGDPGVI
ncbi:MAG: isocitrate/isopropylmalate family dehydrogenase [Verrucomicrobiota bacterium]